MRPALALGSALLLLAAGAVAAAGTATGTAAGTGRPGVGGEQRRTLPERMDDTGGGSQLITARAAGIRSTTGTVTWWDRHRGRWVRAGSASARFGSGGLVEGVLRRQGTSTTPTGLYDLPFAFGIAAAPSGTRVAHRPVTRDSWWCQDNRSLSYNRWVEGLPRHCRAAESERLVSYDPQYRHALVIGFNYHRPVRGRGAGIFLHVHGEGSTAGCVSVSEDAMARILAWVRPHRNPHIAIGTDGGPTAITRY
ncbi:L,D-transpeptidase family protein [Streptomyces sp. SP18CS02]|uniref:L,D-transpeptidase family protein n=1 Tax=Streptomyces sp. SP18CS02 TaxID=3002531 RepID=UPI002E763976|nr:L,D-transpeptidase family protein [Streptomyces sp. SP18CS02]MEE1752624.1 hypothetical protein [Streptomyces sp. SP18CS02]